MNGNNGADMERKVISIIWNKELKVGEIIIEEGKYRAYRLSDRHFPMKLFGIRNPLNEVGDDKVRAYIKDRVTPSTREGIGDWLKQIGLTHYDEEDIFYATNGRESGDRCEFIVDWNGEFK